MAKQSIQQFSPTAASNTDIAGIDCNIGWPPANVGAAFRALMGFLANSLQPLALDVTSQGAVPLTAAQAAAMFVSFTGALSGSCTVTLPVGFFIGYAQNNTTGGQNIILTTGVTGKVTVTLPPGANWYVYGIDAAGNITVVSGLGSISSAMSPVVGSDTLDSARQNMAIGNIPGTQTISIAPVGNAFTTITSLQAQGATNQTSLREYMATLGMTVNKGKGLGSPNGDKCTLYVGVEAEAGSGNVWSFNTVLNMDAGSAPDNCLGYELDFNNNYANWGESAGGAGLASPTAYGLAVTGAGAFRSTSAIAISGPGSAIWNRGIVIGSASVSQSTFQDLGNATRSIDIQGTHTYAIDTTTASLSGAALRMGNSQFLSWRNAANNAEIVGITLSNGNNLVLGGPGMGIIGAAGTFTPTADNAYSCGGSAARWTSVWAVNGTIQTSDPELKTDIQPLPDALPIVMKINPVTFKWKSGGAKPVTRTIKKKVQATEMGESSFTIEIRDGVPTRVAVPAQPEPIFDVLPVMDEDGRPVMADIPEQPAVVDKDGKVIKAARPAQIVQMTHRVPRMVEQDVEEIVLEEQPGTRTHWGWLASHIKDATPEGMDWGAYVKSEDGTEGTRPDQMLPVAWKAIQELKAEIDDLRGRLDAR